MNNLPRSQTYWRYKKKAWLYGTIALALAIVSLALMLAGNFSAIKVVGKTIQFPSSQARYIHELIKSSIFIIWAFAILKAADFFCRVHNRLWKMTRRFEMRRRERVERQKQRLFISEREI